MNCRANWHKSSPFYLSLPVEFEGRIPMNMRLVISGFLFFCVGVICAAEDQTSFWSKIASFFTKPGNKKAEAVVDVAKRKLDEDTIKILLIDAQGVIYAIFVNNLSSQFCYVATGHINASNFTGAIENLLQILEDTADHQQANALLGTSFLAIERADLAESFLYTAVRMSNFSDVAAICNLAESLRLNGDLDLAIEVLQKSISKQQGGSAGILEFQMGEMLSGKQDFAEAANWYLSAALQNPQKEEAWLRASTLQFPPAGQNYTVAESVLTQALTVAPGSAEVVFQLGESLS